MSDLVGWLAECWLLFVVSAPWLVFGFLSAGFIKTLVPRRLIERAMQKPGLRSVATASLIGIPLPLCSCSVIPVAVSLRRSGASRGSTAGFMVSTPEIGVDSFLLSYVLLGPFLAVARVIASFVSAFAVGMSIETWGEKDSPEQVSPKPSCCCSTGSKLSVNPDKLSAAEIVKRSLAYGFGDIVDDLARLLVIGFLLAGAAAYLLPPDIVASANLSSMSAMLIAMLISTPVYICSTSTTPLAAALLLKGVSPGAIVVFLLAGPATNITTMLAVKQELGTRSLGLYLAAITFTTLLAGISIDYLITPDTALLSAPEQLHADHYGIFHTLCAAFLLALISFRLLKSSLAQRESGGAAASGSAACH